MLAADSKSPPVIMGPHSAPETVPIMRVSAQPAVPPFGPIRDLQVNLTPRKFLVRTTGSSSSKKQRSNISTPSASTDLASPFAQSARLNFVTTAFRNGVQLPSIHAPDNGEPPKKRRKTTGCKTYFTTRYPVQNADDVHRDIWRQIFNFCDPKFLLEARSIDSVRHDILSHHQAIWRNSRLRHLGDDCPPCPTSLSEQQYVNLLIGRGCQIRTCYNRNTSTVSWTFLGRLCMDCLLQRTIRPDGLEMDYRHPFPDASYLWDALPMAHYTSNRHGPPREVNEQGTDWAVSSRNNWLILKSDYDRLQSEYYEKQSQDITEEDLKQWWQEKKNHTLRHMGEVLKISKWIARTRWEQGGSITSDRRHFFKEKALRLTPPMSGEELECMAAFHKAMRSTNPPSNISWGILLEKIQRHRDVAAQIVEVQREVADSYKNWNNPSHAISLDRELRNHRQGRNRDPKIFAPEQMFVIKLGRREFGKCIERDVSDHNLVLTCLKDTFDAYEKLSDRPDGLSYDGTQGSYKLSMDDVCMIIEEVIEPEIPSGCQKRSRVLCDFKCPGCRVDYQRKRSFVDSLKHLYLRHSQQVGDDGEFWRLLKPCDSSSRGFPFFSIPWMRCLPVLPSYCDARSMPPWTPDSETRLRHEEAGCYDSAFEGRTAAWHGEGQPEFLGAFRHALSSLQGVTLKARCVTRVALQYACDLAARFELDVPTLDDFMRATPKIQKAHPKIQFKFRCETCFRSEDDVARARPVKFEVAIDQLYKHWNSKHSEQGLDWTQDFMRLPSDAELLVEILKSDEKLRKEKDEIIAFVQEKQMKKRPNSKATVVLGMPFAMDIFAELYPKAD